jgi:uncharacterized protein YkwD
MVAELLLLSGLLAAPEIAPIVSAPGAETQRVVAINLVSGNLHDRPRDAQLLLRDLNLARASSGLTPLSMEPRLCELARRHALDMVAHRFFGHASSDGASPFQRMRRAGYEYRAAGENLALDVDEPSAHAMLWRSNEHRANMLEPQFAHVGIAAVETANGEIFVEDFSD